MHSNLVCYTKVTTGESDLATVLHGHKTGSTKENSAGDKTFLVASNTTEIVG